MEIFYKQPEANTKTLLSSLQISNVFLKKLSLKKDSVTVAKKFHHHTGYEIHIITNGMQAYEIGEKIFTANAGEMVIIPPGHKHRLVDALPFSEKFSVTFTSNNKDINQLSPTSSQHTQRLIDNLVFIDTERQKKLQNSVALIENSVFETIVMILRTAGFIEKTISIPEQNENAILVIAKQYIKDNIELTPNVNEVAKYCGMSTKQLTRIFTASGTTPHAYLQKMRIKLIQHLLTDTDLSLKQISERLNFNNEYYFNSFFKKYSGMPPGEYRAMQK